MRTIQYDMILSKPYRIDRIPDIRDCDGIPSAKAIKLPGIRMIVEECKDLEKFFASFDYCCVGNFHPKFERQMRGVLRGELLEWELDSVWVDDCQLWLSFMNKALFDKYSSKLQDIKAWNASCPRFLRRFSPPPFYSETVFSYKPDVGAKLRFEFDNPVSGNTEVTVVSFFRRWGNSVIEFDGNKCRSFTFGRKSSLQQYPVRVKEWML